MSELSKLLKKITRQEPAPMGFGRGPSKPGATMLLAAIVGDRWAAAAGEAASAGADLVLLAGDPSDGERAGATSAADGRPCGLITRQAEAGQLTALREAGIDFFAFDGQAPARALQEDEGGLLFHLKDDLTDIQLRTIEALPVEAIFFDRDAPSGTIMRQMELQRVSGLARKPLLVAVPPDVEQDDLLCLRDAGVALVAIDLSDAGASEAIARLRGLIDALPPRKKRREDRADVTLPGATASAAEDDDEDDFDDD
jgi:hypothetical protein